MKRTLWLGLALGAVWWPGRVVTSFDGVPLDGRLEAIVLGLAFPLALWWHPDFVLRRGARVLIVTLVAAKALASLSFVQQGWCGQIVNQPASVPKSTPPATWDGIQRSFDFRTDWRVTPPACSAIVARGYHDGFEFPMWFTNVVNAGRPGQPGHVHTFVVEGYAVIESPGTLSYAVGPGMQPAISVDGVEMPAATGSTPAVALTPGIHHIRTTAVLDDASFDSWRFVPAWNSSERWWASTLTTIAPPRRADVLLWRAARSITTFAAMALVLWWVSAAFGRFAPAAGALPWTAAAACAMAALAWGPFERVSSLVLFGAVLFPAAAALAGSRGAFLLIGIPWLSFFAAREIGLSDRFVLYSVGDDFTTFQQFAYRIFMEGYWLEGGQKTFYYQPLYAWIAGTLHLIFGDSSIGEVYADAVWLLVGALFAFYVVKELAGVRAGLVAAGATLATCTIGPIWYLIGRGLSEITASGFAYLTAFCLLRGRGQGWILGAVAGAFATLTFYTRLNHLGWMISMTALCLPLTLPSHGLVKLRSIARQIPYRVIVAYAVVLAIGVGLLAVRTWHYTGVFSLLYGTQANSLRTGLRLSTIVHPNTWPHVLRGFWVVATVQEPGGLNLRGLIVTGGTLASVLALLQVPFFKRLPLGLAIACVGAVAGSLIVSGNGYPGRFSVHVVPISTAIAVCALAVAVNDLKSTLTPRA